MKLTPAIKGQLTKAVTRQTNASYMSPNWKLAAVRHIFLKHMPAEQAKHAARKYLAAFQG